MKGIISCKECANFKWGKCKKKAHIKGVDFFADCPLPEVLKVNPEAGDWSMEDVKHKTVCGYPLDEVLCLAEIMVAQNVQKEDVKDFVKAMEHGYRHGINLGKKAWYEALERVMDD